MRNTELVQWFRQSTPYVNMHRGKKVRHYARRQRDCPFQFCEYCQ